MPIRGLMIDSRFSEHQILNKKKEEGPMKAFEGTFSYIDWPIRRPSPFSLFGNGKKAAILNLFLRERGEQLKKVSLQN